MRETAPTDDALARLGAAQAVAAMRRGEIAAEAYAGALLARAGRLARLNAFLSLDREAVLAAARAADRARAAGAVSGPLHGLPVPVKDSVNTAALPTTNGTRALVGFRPARDAAVVARLLGAGALLMGKTGLHELSFGWTSDNGSFGAVRNPYDPARSPGGSSGGSAAAVAARLAPLAVAEDTWASIRLPAAFCGLAGLRPSPGRHPGEGIMPLTHLFDQVGPVARHVEDLLLFDRVAAQDASPVSATPLARARLGLPAGLWEGLSSEVERVARAGLERLRAAGATLVEAPAPEAARAAPDIAGTVIAREARDSIDGFLARHGAPASFEQVFAQVAPNVKTLLGAMALPPNRPSREAYEAALARREALIAALDVHYREGRLDALVFPVALTTAPPIGAETEVAIDGRPVPAATALARNAALGSVAGLASLVLPAGLDRDGLPVGLEFAAPPGRDRAILALGLSLETALGAIPPPDLSRPPALGHGRPVRRAPVGGAGP